MKNNKLVSYVSPFKSPRLFRDEFLTSVDNYFDSVFNDWFPGTSKEVGLGFLTKEAYPKVNVLDQEKQLTIEAHIPGLTREQVNVEIRNGVLTIKGNKQEEKEEKGEYVYRELKRTAFQRSFSLDENLDSEKIDAKFENGVLNVVIPKKTPMVKPEDKVTKVEVK